jgi:23S rRNA pseudouridine2605 synthase
MESPERLQKIIATAGIASRRKAELLIQQGRVSVNGQIVTQLGAKADPKRDHIKVDGKLVRKSPQKVYLLLNKPREVISSVSDPEGRLKVTDLVDVRTKIYPVGRLDYNTEGLILLTNDGEFSRIVTAAGTHMAKVYQVKVRSTPDRLELAHLRSGMRLNTGIQLAPCRIVPLKEGTNSWYEVTLTQGKNRQIRDMFEAIGHPVVKLRRIRIGFLTNHGLAAGQYRHLTAREVERILRLGGKR